MSARPSLARAAKGVYWAVLCERLALVEGDDIEERAEWTQGYIDHAAEGWVLALRCILESLPTD